MALQTRNVLKRLYAYAIARGKTTFSPAVAVEARYIASARSRDVALSSDDVGKLLRAIHQSNMNRRYKRDAPQFPHACHECWSSNDEIVHGYNAQ
jgi:hypothetical protein